MKKILSLALLSSLFALYSLAAPKSASASEGVIEMRNVIGQQSRCYATSVLTSDLQYNIIVSCRDLLYPVSQELFRYVVWTTPTTGTITNPIKLGELGIGKVLYKTQTPFSSIFVTQEKTAEVTTPSSQVAMRGNVASIPFLDNPSAARVISEEPTLSPNPSASPAASARNIGTLLRSGAVVTVIAIFVIILMLVLVKPFK